MVMNWCADDDPKEQTMNGIKPNKAMQARHNKMRQIGCIICLKYRNVFTPCEIHHINGAQTQQRHAETLGLCQLDHMGEQLYGPNSQYISRHPNKKAFEKRYGTEQELLECQNRLLDENHN